jgi:anti-sigma factor RsiW
MNCRDVQRLLHPYSDGELDLVRNVEIEEHLMECAECSERAKNLRTLRAAISSPSLYHRAPASLGERIQLAIPAALDTPQVQLAAPLATRGRRRSSLQLAAMAASVLLLIGASATIGILLFPGPSADDRLAERIVASHVRSLQVDHLTDVASSDKHTVKPWFRGKLDFSPQVPDLSAEGYILTGGRMDYLTDRPVAVLVYSRRLHAINVFTWPAVDDENKAVRKSSQQGYQIRTWNQSKMTYWAVSDLNDQEFDEFVKLFQAKCSQSPP